MVGLKQRIKEDLVLFPFIVFVLIPILYNLVEDIEYREACKDYGKSINKSVMVKDGLCYYESVKGVWVHTRDMI